MDNVHATQNLEPQIPSRELTTPLDWTDLILDSKVMEQVNEITTWIKHGKALMEDWGLGKKVNPGYRAIFYGPPGTGKKLTAALIGKATGTTVCLINLTIILSSNMEDTSKNLFALFEEAQRHNWILLLEEADKLFEKRTETSDSHDRYANQQTAYLLQRIEEYPGLVILISNISSNMDEALARRFQAIIHFAMPSAQERYQLWKQAFSGSCSLHESIDLHKIAEEYELTGGNIINVLRYCALAAIQRQSNQVTEQELLAAIKRETGKSK